jgi:uncharacterized protein (TIGR02145 family)
MRSVNSFIFNSCDIMKTRKYSWLVIIIFVGLALKSCKKEPTVSLPVVKTYAPEFVSSTVMTVGFRVESNGGSKITDCGLYVGNVASPETLGSKISIGADTGTFYVQIKGLIAATQFYMKAYAVNSKGQGLGEQEIFTTPAKILDFENNPYETVVIYTQTWMATNLKTTHYLNGDVIGTTTPPTFDISGESTPKYQWSYGGDDGYAPVYGKLYTYYTITDSRKICPAGWHIPTDADWITLENALGGATYAASFLKESGNDHWISPYNLDGANITCFTALPGGYRNFNGTFSFIGNYGFWWSSTEGDASNSWVRSMFVQSGQVSRTNFAKRNGASIRCVKD